MAEEIDNDESADKQAQAVSIDVYDKLKGVQDAIEYLASIGISAIDFQPENLQFFSASFEDCIVRVEQSLTTSEELAIGRVSCLMRHSDEFRANLSR